MPAADARVVPRRNTAFRLYFDMRTGAQALVTSWSGQDSEVSIDGASFTDCTNEAVEIGSFGVGYLDLTANETNGYCVAIKVTLSNTGAVTALFYLYPEAAGDIRVDTVQIAGVSAAAQALTTARIEALTNLNATVDSRLATSAYTAPANADIAAVKAQTDQLTFVSGEVVTTVDVQGDLTAQGYTSVRAELLDNLDEPVSGVGGGGGATVEEIWAAAPQGKITVISAVEALTGNITIVRGDTYAEAQARGLRWSSADWENWNLATATIVFKAKSKLSRSIFTTAVTDVNATTVQLELTSVETAAFALDDYRFDIEAALANGEVHTLVQGTMRVRADVR